MSKLISRRTAKRIFLRTAPLLGIDRACRGATQALPRICMYHRFARAPEYRKLSLAAFERQLDAIARHFKVVPMREVGRQLVEHGTVEPSLAVITIDDGYADFQQVAVPALQKRGMSATFYVTTAFVEGEFWLWPDRLEVALSETREQRLDCERGNWPLATESDKRRAWSALVDVCVQLPTAEKDQLIAEVLHALKVALPSRPSADYAPVGHDDLRALSRAGFEIGAHTRSHPILSRSPQSDLHEEIAGCKAALERIVDCDVVSFCYPNGQRADISQAAKDAVRTAGFSSAVAAYFAHDVLRDRYEIKRYGPGDDLVEMQSFLSGFEHVIDRRRPAGPPPVPALSC